MADEPNTTEQSDEANEKGEGGEQYDAPNQQAVGQEPPWVEGTGGSSGEGGETEPAQDAGDTGDAEETGLDSMTKAQLLEYAKSKGISPANNDMTKEELRASIDEAEH